MCSNECLCPQREILVLVYLALQVLQDPQAVKVHLVLKVILVSLEALVHQVVQVVMVPLDLKVENYFMFKLRKNCYAALDTKERPFDETKMKLYYKYKTIYLSSSHFLFALR